MRYDGVLQQSASTRNGGSGAGPRLIVSPHGRVQYNNMPLRDYTDRMSESAVSIIRESAGMLQRPRADHPAKRALPYYVFLFPGETSEDIVLSSLHFSVMRLAMRRQNRDPRKSTSIQYMDAEVYPLTMFAAVESAAVQLRCVIINGERHTLAFVKPVLAMHPKPGSASDKARPGFPADNQSSQPTSQAYDPTKSGTLPWTWFWDGCEGSIRSQFVIFLTVDATLLGNRMRAPDLAISYLIASYTFMTQSGKVETLAERAKKEMGGKKSHVQVAEGVLLNTALTTALYDHTIDIIPALQAHVRRMLDDPAIGEITLDGRNLQTASTTVSQNASLHGSSSAMDSAVTTTVPREPLHELTGETPASDPREMPTGHAHAVLPDLASPEPVSIKIHDHSFLLPDALNTSMATPQAVSKQRSFVDEGREERHETADEGRPKSGSFSGDASDKSVQSTADVPLSAHLIRTKSNSLGEPISPVLALGEPHAHGPVSPGVFNVHTMQTPLYQRTNNRPGSWGRDKSSTECDKADGSWGRDKSASECDKADATAAENAPPFPRELMNNLPTRLAPVPYLTRMIARVSAEGFATVENIVNAFLAKSSNDSNVALEILHEVTQYLNDVFLTTINALDMDLVSQIGVQRRTGGVAALFSRILGEGSAAPAGTAHIPVPPTQAPAPEVRRAPPASQPQGPRRVAGSRRPRQEMSNHSNDVYVYRAAAHIPANAIPLSPAFTHPHKSKQKLKAPTKFYDFGELMHMQSPQAKRPRTESRPTSPEDLDTTIADHSPCGSSNSLNTSFSTDSSTDVHSSRSGRLSSPTRQGRARAVVAGSPTRHAHSNTRMAVSPTRGVRMSVRTAAASPVGAARVLNRDALAMLAHAMSITKTPAREPTKRGVEATPGSMDAAISLVQIFNGGDGVPQPLCLNTIAYSPIRPPSVSSLERAAASPTTVDTEEDTHVEGQK